MEIRRGLLVALCVTCAAVSASAQPDTSRAIAGEELTRFLPERLGEARQHHAFAQVWGAQAAYELPGRRYITLDVKSVLSPSLARSQTERCQTWETIGGHSGCVLGMSEGDYVMIRWVFENRIEVVLGGSALGLDVVREHARHVNLDAIRARARR